MIFSRTILLGIALSCCITANASDILGDIDGDGNLSIIDVTLLVSHVLGDQEVNTANADMNKDKEVNITDVVLLVDTILHPEDNQPGTQDGDANPDLPVLAPLNNQSN